MNERSILLTIVVICILFACDTRARRSDNQTEFFKLDSIKKANDLNEALARKDSIEETEVKKYIVKRLSGKHKYGGVTKIEYQSLTQLIADLKTRSNSEMWTKEKLESTIELYKNICKGGSIRLSIERPTIDAADTRFFSIIIKDKNENEKYRVDLPSDIPETPNSNDYWWNIRSEWIPERIEKPFFVYVVDRLADEPFKFEVNKVKK